MLSTYDMAILEGKKEMQIEAIKGFLLKGASEQLIAEGLNIPIDKVSKIKKELEL